MKLTDDQIKSIMEKNVATKTILVDNILLKKTVSDYEKEGWKLLKKTEVNGRQKLTFQKDV